MKKQKILNLVSGLIIGMIYLCFGGMIVFDTVIFGIICYLLGWVLVIVMLINKNRKMTGEDMLELLNIINENRGDK